MFRRMRPWQDNSLNLPAYKKPYGAKPAAFFAINGYSITKPKMRKERDSDERMMARRMRWVYFNKLYRTKFQAGCLARRLEQDGWIYGFDDMREIEIYRSRKGKYGVRFIV